jgi:hypothetical protein
MDAAAVVSITNHNTALRQTAREFFELGEAFAFLQTAFSQVAYKAKVYGGDFERACSDIKEKHRAIPMSLSREKLEAAQVVKALNKADRDLHRLQSNVVSVLLISKQSGYDVAG